MKDKLVIVLHGRARSGKDCFYDHSKRVLGGKVSKASLAARMKEMGAVFFKISIDKLEETKDVIHPYGDTPRALLRRIGDIGKEVYGEDVWINILLEDIHKANSEIVFVTDCRFTTELELIRDEFPNTIGIKIKRESVDQGAITHATEAGISDEFFDIIVENNGTLEEYLTTVGDLLGHLEGV